MGRRRFRSLELLFGVPNVDLTELPQPDDWTRPRRPGEDPGDTEEGDEAVAMDRDEPTEADESVQDPPQNSAEPLPPRFSPPILTTLTLYGRSALSATMRSWWTYWRRRARIASHYTLFRDACNDGQRITPAGTLLHWLHDMGWTGERLSPSEAANWALR